MEEIKMSNVISDINPSIFIPLTSPSNTVILPPVCQDLPIVEIDMSDALEGLGSELDVAG